MTDEDGKPAHLGLGIAQSRSVAIAARQTTSLWDSVCDLGLLLGSLRSNAAQDLPAEVTGGEVNARTCFSQPAFAASIAAPAPAAAAPAAGEPYMLIYCIAGHQACITYENTGGQCFPFGSCYFTAKAKEPKPKRYPHSKSQ